MIKKASLSIFFVSLCALLLLRYFMPYVYLQYHKILSILSSLIITISLFAFCFCELNDTQKKQNSDMN